MTPIYLYCLSDNLHEQRFINVSQHLLMSDLAFKRLLFPTPVKREISSPFRISYSSSTESRTLTAAFSILLLGCLKSPAYVRLSPHRTEIMSRTSSLQQLIPFHWYTCLVNGSSLTKSVTYGLIPSHHELVATVLSYTGSCLSCVPV